MFGMSLTLLSYHAHEHHVRQTLKRRSQWVPHQKHLRTKHRRARPVLWGGLCSKKSHRQMGDLASWPVSKANPSMSRLPGNLWHPLKRNIWRTQIHRLWIAETRAYEDPFGCLWSCMVFGPCKKLTPSHTIIQESCSDPHALNPQDGQFVSKWKVVAVALHSTGWHRCSFLHCARWTKYLNNWNRAPYVWNVTHTFKLPCPWTSCKADAEEKKSMGAASEASADKAPASKASVVGWAVLQEKSQADGRFGQLASE